MNKLAYGIATSFLSLVMSPALFVLICDIFLNSTPPVWVLAVRQNPRIAIADQVWLNDGDIRLATFSTCIVVPRTANETPVL